MDTWVFETDDGNSISIPGVNKIMAFSCFEDWYPDEVQHVVNVYKEEE